MHGGRHLPGTQEADGNGEPISHTGLLAWWQRRSWRMDLAVLARVRDGLKRLDTELGFDAPAGRPRANPADPAGGADPVEFGNVDASAAPPHDAAADTAAPPAEPAAQG